MERITSTFIFCLAIQSIFAALTKDQLLSVLSNTNPSMFDPMPKFEPQNRNIVLDGFTDSQFQPGFGQPTVSDIDGTIEIPGTPITQTRDPVVVSRQNIEMPKPVAIPPTGSTRWNRKSGLPKPKRAGKPQKMRNLRSGKSQMCASKKQTQKRKRIPVTDCAEHSESGEHGSDLTVISAEDGNQEMLQLAAEAEAAVPPEERNTEWPIKVMGRLGLTGSKSGKTYEVSRTEIQRRTGQPEHLSGSAICQYLKRRRQATELPNDIPVLAKKRKTCSSLFTLLTEGEARDLARDFGSITEEERFFARLGQNINPDNQEAVRDSCIQLLEALDKIETEQCRASLRQHGFLVPAVREVFKQLYNGL